MAVRTKSIYKPADAEDGYRILITRFYPRGVPSKSFDEWTTTLSPNPELLFAYKQGKIDWNIFAHEFLNQLRNDVSCLEAIQTLHELSASEDITLLCFEKDGNPCHRHLVRDVIEHPEVLTR